ncbi:LOW QUALITY PROTEIN: zinc finger MYM-type protein 2-like [Diadema setosum]|uniref:LOW QUALITY PROTEIN: zinc finger MYM-type protein 2-like n=1 Tax=Diadema setosum TaxID=31175 RepID=UPI003B3A80C5
MACSTNRFASLGEDDLDQLIDEKDSKSTKRVINLAENILKAYTEAKGLSISETITAQELNKFLRSFYAEVRRSNGEFYSKRSMITLRYGLQRHFKKVSAFDVVNDPQFKEANEMFHAILVKLKKEGKGSVVHKDPITQEDMLKIKSSSALDVSTPRGLQNKVFVDIMLHLCNRGRENLRNFSKTDFDIATDSTNERYVYLASDKLTKNHRGESLDDSRSQQGRMYETHKPDCPVEAFQVYVSHLNPGNDDFFQRPKVNAESDEQVWYCNAPVGKNTLGDKMRKISLEAQTSKIYTNHCLRATSIHVLDASSGFEARHIMSVSGHKSESSIKHYAYVDEAKKRRMSRCLSSVSDEAPSTMVSILH